MSAPSAAAAAFQETVRRFQQQSGGVSSGSAKPQQPPAKKLGADRTEALTAVFGRGAMPKREDGSSGLSPTSPSLDQRVDGKDALPNATSVTVDQAKQRVIARPPPPPIRPPVRQGGLSKPSESARNTGAGLTVPSLPKRAEQTPDLAARDRSPSGSKTDSDRSSPSLSKRIGDSPTDPIPPRPRSAEGFHSDAVAPTVSSGGMKRSASFSKAPDVDKKEDDKGGVAGTIRGGFQKLARRLSFNKGEATASASKDKAAAEDDDETIQELMRQRYSEKMPFTEGTFSVRATLADKAWGYLKFCRLYQKDAQELEKKDKKVKEAIQAYKIIKAACALGLEAIEQQKASGKEANYIDFDLNKPSESLVKQEQALRALDFGAGIALAQLAEPKLKKRGSFVGLFD